MDTLGQIQDLHINSSCRTCLKNITLDPIHHEIFEIRGLPEKISACSTLPVERGDGFPTSLCASCFKKIDNFYAFQRLCISANTKFLEYVGVDKKPCITQIRLKNDVDSTTPFKVVDMETDENQVSASTSIAALLKVEAVINEEAPQVQVKTVNKIVNGRRQRINYVCDVCNKPFMKLCTYQVHLRLHRGLKAFPCQLCDLSYSRRIKLKEHMKNKHKGKINAKFVCIELDCDRLFTSKNLVLKHLKEKHWINGKEPGQPLACKECGLIQLNIDVHIKHLQEHKVQKEEELKNPGLKKKFKCLFCEKSYNHKKDRNSHIRVIHEGVKEYACSFCKKLFATAINKKHHEMTHTGEKPHQCSVCLKRYIQITSLRLHKCIKPEIKK